MKGVPWPRGGAEILLGSECYSRLSREYGKVCGRRKALRLHKHLEATPATQDLLCPFYLVGPLHTSEGAIHTGENATVALWSQVRPDTFLWMLVGPILYEFPAIVLWDDCLYILKSIKSV